jgi:Tfp pilus assembly protein PilP
MNGTDAMTRPFAVPKKRKTRRPIQSGDTGWRGDVAAERDRLESFALFGGQPSKYVPCLQPPGA